MRRILTLTAALAISAMACASPTPDERGTVTEVRRDHGRCQLLLLPNSLGLGEQHWSEWLDGGAVCGWPIREYTVWSNGSFEVVYEEPGTAVRLDYGLDRMGCVVQTTYRGPGRKGKTTRQNFNEQQCEAIPRSASVSRLSSTTLRRS